MLVLSISENLDKLLENGRLAAIAPLGKLGRVVVVAVDTALVLVVAVRGAEDGRTDGTGKVLDVVFAVKSGDVGAAQSLSTLEAQQVESSEIVGLAQRVLARGLLGNGKEFGGNNLVAVLEEGQPTSQSIHARVEDCWYGMRQLTTAEHVGQRYAAPFCFFCSFFQVGEENEKSFLHGR